MCNDHLSLGGFDMVPGKITMMGMSIIRINCRENYKAHNYIKFSVQSKGHYLILYNVRPDCAEEWDDIFCKKTCQG